jgi:hypothetical protein
MGTPKLKSILELTFDVRSEFLIIISTILHFMLSALLLFLAALPSLQNGRISGDFLLIHSKVGCPIKSILKYSQLPTQKMNATMTPKCH